MTSRNHGSTISGLQQDQQRRRRQGEGQKIIRSGDINKQQLCTCITLFCTFCLLSLHHYDMKLPNSTSPLYGIGEHNTKIVAFFF